MGIRYYAYPVEAEHIEQARNDPYLFLSEDPLMDAWGPDEKRPPMLYLDKCWRELQELTRPVEGFEPRPAFRLFEGQVIFSDSMHGSWYAWTRVLDPLEIADIARDLVLLDDADIRTKVTVRPWQEPEGEFSYVRHHLTAAQKFIADLADRGSGVVYMIS